MKFDFCWILDVGLQQTPGGMGPFLQSKVAAASLTSYTNHLTLGPPMTHQNGKSLGDPGAIAKELSSSSWVCLTRLSQDSLAKLILCG